MEDTGRGLKSAAGGKRLCQGSAQGSSGCAQKHCGDALSAHQCLVLIQEKGDQKEYGKVQKAHGQAPEKFSLSHLFADDKPCKYRRSHIGKGYAKVCDFCADFGLIHNKSQNT